MNRTSTTLVLTLLGGSFLAGSAHAQASNPLAEQARSVLKKHCYQCHGINLEADVDVMQHKLMIDKKFVVPNNLEKSRLWVRAGVKGNMPPKDITTRPSPEELQTLKAWIEAGAPEPQVTVVPVQRLYRSDREVLQAIHADMLKTPTGERKYKRYFTMTNLYNNPKISERDLCHCRAALSKLVNSLSWQPVIVLPEPIDGNYQTATVYKIDLRNLGWERNGLWKDLVQAYPYGVTYANDKDLTMQKLANDVYQLSESPLPYLRADWFVVNAAQPPLYHTLLFDEVLPELRKRKIDKEDAANPKKMTALDLEYYLGLNVLDNYAKNNMQRAGFAKSGISAQNRMVERHDSPRVKGAYWKSYDFKPKNNESDLLRFPLGPKFDNHPFPKLAFDHDGGEIIFNLPNGMQGYLLVDAQDKRINVGPADVVGDPSKVIRSTEIINGISCMICHNQGMKDFTDQIRFGAGVGGDAQVKVQKLYPDKQIMDLSVNEDSKKFLTSFDLATRRYLNIDPKRETNVRDFDEPIRVITQYYLADLTPLEAACELDVYVNQNGQKKVGDQLLQNVIQGNLRLQQIGLGGLAQGGLVTRQSWEELRGISTYHQAAREFGKSANRPLK